jgi:acyl-CoA synthetase (AMP-forming)/AMP-acid ligase II
MAEYWRDPDGTARTCVRDWLRTGDLGLIDERGFLRLAGRLKEMFIRGGYNVYPAEVESVLADHPGVAEVVVVPRPDAVMGEVGVAVVVPADAAAPPTLEDLRAHCQGRLAGFKHPRRLELARELPRTAATGQVQRALLVERIVSGAGL